MHTPIECFLNYIFSNTEIENIFANIMLKNTSIKKRNDGPRIHPHPKF